MGENSMLVSFDSKFCRLSFVSVFRADRQAGEIALLMSFNLTLYCLYFAVVFSAGGEVDSTLIEVSLHKGTEPQLLN